MTADAGAAVRETLFRCWDLYARGDSAGLRAELEALPEAQLLDEPELGLLLMGALIATYDTRGAAALGERMQPAVRRRGDARQQRRLANLQAQVALHEGRLSDAERELLALEAESAAVGDALTRFYAWGNLGILSAMRCEFDDAVGWFRRAVVIMQELGAINWGMPLHQSMGRAYREMERPAEAEQHFQQARRFAGTAHEIHVIHLERSILKAQTGDVEVADAMAVRALEHFSTHGRASGVCQAHRARAAAALHRGDWEGARAQLELARRSLPPDDPLLEAEIEEDAALAELRLGHAAESALHATRAADGYARMEAPRRAERMRQRLAGAGA